MRTIKDTRTHLVAELSTLHQTPEIAEIILEARQGYFHDFKSEEYVVPKGMLIQKLRAAGLEDLAGRVIAGEFDEEPDEEDREEMRKILPRNKWWSYGLERGH